MFYSVNSFSEIEKAKCFVRNGFYSCPYLYTNLMRYGVEKNKTELFLDYNEDCLQAVGLLYYDCLHVYYHNAFQGFDDLKSLINEQQPRTIFFPSFHNEQVWQIEGYKGKEVLVMAPQKFMDIDVSLVKRAKMSDIPRIAQFMYTHWNDIYESPDSICEQVEERMKDGYGRTKYYEENGEIVACVSSFAELDDFAVCGGLLVSESQRGKKLGSVMLKSIYEELENEGKKTCGIIVEDYSRIFHEKNGFVTVGKIVKYNCI